MQNNHHPHSSGTSMVPWTLIFFVLGLVVLFFGFTDLARVTEISPALFCGFLSLLFVTVLLGNSRPKPRA